MKYLFICCCSFFFIGSLSAQTFDHREERYSLADGYERPTFGVVIDTEGESENDGGGISNGTDCTTMTSKISET